MPQLNPPLPPSPAIVGGDDSRKHLKFRLWQLLMSTLTILVAVWFTTYGPVPGILAWVVAKHIFVALLMMGLHRYPRYKDEADSAAAGA